MTHQIYPIPFASGMDQSISTAVGEARLLRAERVRLIEPGKMQLSPGYYWDTAFGTNLRAAVQCGDTTVVVKSTGTHYNTLTRSSSSTHVETRYDGFYAVPAYEAPERVDYSPASALTGTSATSLIDVRSWCAAVSADLWLWLIECPIAAGLNYYVLRLMRGAEEIWSTPYTTASLTIRLATDYTSGLSYAVYNNSATSELTIATINLSTLALTTVASVTDSSSYTMVDAAVSSSYSAATLIMLDSSGVVRSRVVSTGGGITDVALPAPPVFSYTELMIVPDATKAVCIAITPDGYARAVNSTSGAVASTATYYPGAVSSTLLMIRAAIGKQATPTGAMVSWSARTHTAATFTQTFLTELVIPASSASPLTLTQHTTGNLNSIVIGAPIRRLDASSNPFFYQHLISQATVLRSCLVAEVKTSTSNRRLMTHAADGEMPVFGQSVQTGGPAPSATPSYITVRDSLCQRFRGAYVYVFATAAAGDLTGSTCQLNSTALIVPVEATSMTGAVEITGTDTLCPIKLDDSSTLLTNGSPWLDGQQQFAAGFPLDGPSPTVAENTGGGTVIFAQAAVYQWLVVAEFRDDCNTLYRSAPTSPTSHTISAANCITMRVTADWEAAGPYTPGQLRLYRTTANGSVFYDTGLTSQLQSTPVTTYNFDDGVADAILATHPLLTQGPAVSGGLKSKYGVPPCKFGWRGKDRVIIGGVENPNRVRWSQTLFPGEGLCFPHATDVGWSMDFPERVTAVASLDDAWIVFSRQHVWAVFGLGPDDNGANGVFESPRLISPTCGALTWRSVAEVDEGLLFQSPDGQIYLIARGQLSVSWFSAPVRLELASGMVGTHLTNPIIATITHSAGQTVHFIRAKRPDSTGSAPIVYDRRTQSWTMDGDTTSEGLYGAISGTTIDVPSGVAGRSLPTVVIVTPNYLVVEACGGTAGGSPSGATWVGLLETNDVAPFGVAGWGRISRIGLVSYSTANTAYTLSTWRSRNQAASADDVATLTLADSGGADFPFLQRTPAADKCSALRVRIEWSDTATNPAAIVLSVEPATGSQRLPTTRKS